MENIIEPDAHFDFSKLSLVNPSSVQGGSYFTKILYNGKPLYIQTPKSLTREGIQKNGKKFFCDLMFDLNNEDFITWIENLESRCQKMVHAKSIDWFDSSLELTDIESAFSSSLKLYKSGKNYLLRGHVKTNAKTQEPILKIFNEDETVLSMEEITQDTQIICIVEILGIKFTTRNFQIEYELKQVMSTTSTENIFESFMIKNKKKIVARDESSVKPLLEIKESLNKIPTPDTKTNTQIEDNAIQDQDSLDNESLSSEVLENLSASIFETMDKDKEKEKDNYSIAKEMTTGKNKSVGLSVGLSVGQYAGDNKELKMSSVAGGRDNMDYSRREQRNNLEDYIEENIVLDIEDLNALEDDANELKEVNIPKLDKNNPLETIALKKPNEVYYEIYKEARKRAKDAKKSAVLAYLEARNIKKTYMLDDIDSSDSESDNDDESDNDPDYSLENV